MIDLNIHVIDIIKPESLQSLRESQVKTRYIIPSDYVYFLLNYGKMKFSNVPFLFYNNDEYEFFEFYDLENLDWQIDDKRNNSIDFSESYWSDDVICIGQLVAKSILIGIKNENINKIYLFDNEKNYVEYICDNLYCFINEYLKYK